MRPTSQSSVPLSAPLGVIARGSAVIDQRIVLHLDPAAKLYVKVNVCALADDALLADPDALAHLRLVPDTRAGTDLGLG